METMMFATEGITKSERFLGTPSEFALNHLVYVQEIGRLKSIKPHSCIREKLDSYLIFLVTKGSGKVSIEGKEQQLVMGDCVFIDCQQHYSHQSSEKDPWELMWVHCYGKDMDAFHALFMEKNEGQEIVTIEDTERLKGYLERLIHLQKKQELLMELKSSILIEQIVAYLVEEAMEHRTDRTYVVYNHIREYINENYQKHALVEQVSDLFQIDAEEMDNNFQKIYGIDIYDYILNRRFTKAKELLRFTTKPITEIVEESGICNDDLFRKLFKEHEKMTAEEYRKKWAQWVRNK